MLTVQDVLKIDILRDAKVLTAKHKLSTQPVEWVSIMDIPVENYIRKNEFVLNTGAGSGKDMDVFHQFVESVYESGASALVIAKGRYIIETPKSVVDFAEEKEFIIIEIPWEIRFAEIIHSVMNVIKRSQNKELEIIGDLQQHLLNMVLNNPNPSKIADFIGEKLGHPIIIVDTTGVIKGKSKNAGGLVNKWNVYKRTNDFCSRAFSLINRQHPLQARIERIEVSNYTILQIPIESSNRVQGYLNVELNNESNVDEFLTNYNVSLLEQASVVLAMWFLRESAIEETKMRLRGDFVWSLAKGEFTSWDQKLAQAKSLGYVLDHPYTCLIGVNENLEELYQKSNTDTTNERWKETMLHYIQDEVFLASNIANQKVMTTNHNNDIILFLEVTPNAANEKAYNFLELLSRRLNNLLPGLVISWAIGRCHEGETRFVDSFNDAQVALKIGRKKEGKGCRITYDDTRSERALIRIAKDPEMSDIVNKTIQNLIEYDKQKSTNLIETIVVYNENQGKISQTARSMHLHRHTLLYRLRKIEAITGLSMMDPEDRFLLELSIKLWELGEIDKVI